MLRRSCLCNELRLGRGMGRRATGILAVVSLEGHMLSSWRVTCILRGRHIAIGGEQCSADVSA